MHGAPGKHWRRKPLAPDQAGLDSMQRVDGRTWGVGDIAGLAAEFWKRGFGCG